MEGHKEVVSLCIVVIFMPANYYFVNVIDSLIQFRYGIIKNIGIDMLLDDHKAAELITVITTTHPICSVPSDEHLYLAQASLFINPTLAKSKKIIVFDGVAPEFKDRSSKYDLYKQKIQDLQKTNPIFANTKLLFSEEWVQLSGTIRLALKQVTTPFIFIHQHDMCFTKKFHLNACLSSMLMNKNIKWIHFSGKFHSSLIGNMQSSCFGPADNYVEGNSLIPLTRVYGWSDHAHV